MVLLIIYRETDAFDINIRGFVKMDSDGNYNVYVHRDLSDEAKKKTIVHELRHISFGHLSAADCVEYLESQANGFI